MHHQIFQNHKNYLIPPRKIDFNFELRTFPDDDRQCISTNFQNFEVPDRSDNRKVIFRRNILFQNMFGLFFHIKHVIFFNCKLFRPVMVRTPPKSNISSLSDEVSLKSESSRRVSWPFYFYCENHPFLHTYFSVFWQKLASRKKC